MTFSVLGLLGPAGSGKDLVADWLCDNGFVKIGFADPMKRFARAAFGLTDEQLWGPSQERNKEFAVDDAWWFNAIGNVPAAFDEILNMVLQDGDRSRGYLALMDWFTKLRQEYREKISTRLILQTLGTEWGRAVDPLMWARYAHKVAGQVGGGGMYTQSRGWTSALHGGTRPTGGVVIPDHRFANEVETTQTLGGYAIRLRRIALEEKDVGIVGHKSEAEQKDLSDDLFDLTLEFGEFIIEETKTSVTGESITVKKLDPEGLNRELSKVLQEEAWKQGKGTKRRLSPSS